MFAELVQLAAPMIAYLLRLIVKAGEAEGLSREEALAKLRSSEQLAATIDAREWAELAGSAEVIR